MSKFILRVGAVALLMAVVLVPTSQTLGQRQRFNLADCREIGFSIEEEFFSRGPTPADGNPIISDGDLLGRNGRICARNRDLLHDAFDVDQDMGLDAVDIVSIEQELVAFSTELDSPHGNFKAGDLLTNQGAAVPNQALLAAFGQFPDLGLDALHFVGDTQAIVAFLAYAKDKGRSFWVQNPQAFPIELGRYGIDLWFSIEGTLAIPGMTTILDGDLLSARTGAIIYSNGVWLAAPIPAGLPNRGVDFGLDALGGDCLGNRGTLRFSTEILYRYQNPMGALTDGDVLAFGGGIVEENWELIASFEPATRMVGLDALSYPHWREECVQAQEWDYLPMLMRLYPRGS